MKRFIITNLLAMMVLPMLACAGGWTTNYYLFSVYQRNDFSDRMDDITRKNWKTYLGIGDDEYFWFQADEIIKAAQAKNDALMVSYVQNLDKYLDCAREVSYEVWDYPTKEKLAERNKMLQAIRTYAQSKLKTRLRSQHALLFMRCNMLLKRHQENVDFWEQTASQYIETVYKDMMKNIYAGALYKTGQEAKAGELFAEMGDYNSLMTLYYLKRSYAAIHEEYMKNPNAKVLPFLLQDFVNNAQEADDATNPNAEGIGGKLFIRDISKKEATQMLHFCEQVVKEGKTETPILWQSAKAWLEYMYGNKKQAYSDIQEAVKMNDGTERMQDNARILNLYISLAEAPESQDYDNWLAKELEWLSQKEKENEHEWHYGNAHTRITHQVLVKRYESHPERAIALLREGNSWKYDACIDTMKVEKLEKYFLYTLKTPQTDLDKYLKTHLTKEAYALEDLIGTKYMRLCQWDKAIMWLKDIPESYYNKKGYAVYAANRRYDIGPWIKRQWLKGEKTYSDREWRIGANPKLAFSKDMQKKEGELNILSGEELKKQYYELAVRYAQASFTGDCWFLMHDGKSVMDTVRVNEVDLAAKAASYLQKAGDPKDFLLKEKVMFAKAYVYMNDSPWYDSVWNDETYEYDHKPNPQSAQYKSFAAFADFAKQHNSELSGYVTRCDEYAAFLKAYAKR